MIGGASRIGGAKGFYLAMNSESLNTMILWNSLCIGVGALGAVLKKDKKIRMNIMIIVVAIAIAGSTPLAIAQGVERATLPESGDMYAFFRGASTYQRDFDSTNGTKREQSLENCGIDTCQVTGKTEMIMSLFPGSSFNVDLAESGMTIAKPMKVLIHDYSFNQGLSYEYSQYDYGIGIIEGDSNQGTASLPRDTWYNQDKFADNVDTFIEMFGVVTDKRRLPNNLRQFHYSGSEESIDCGSWSASGDHYSRQVVVPKKDGISFFTADQTVVVNGLFEIVYDGKSIFKTLEEMREGVEVDKGLHVSLADYDKPNPRNLKMFCHHAPGDKFENCHEYNFAALGNPTSEGPGHYQVSKMLRPDQDITTSNHFFGRNDWKQQMTWYRMEGCSAGAPASLGKSDEEDTLSRLISEEDFKTVTEVQGLKIGAEIRGLRSSTVIDVAHMEGRKVYVSNDMVQKPNKESKSLGVSPNNALLEFFGISDIDEKKKIIEACSKSGRFGFFAWLILAILAAIIVAAVTVTVIWQDLKDNCCGLNRYGYNNFDKIDTYAVSLNNSWSAFRPEIRQTGKVINGEPVEMSIDYRNSMDSRGRIMISMDKYDVALNQEQIYVLAITVSECNAFKSGTTGSCLLSYEVVGSGGNVKFTSENCKMNNVMLALKPGINSQSFGINSVSFITETLKFCVSGTNLCSSTGIKFTSSPDGSGDLLENGNPSGGLYMTFGEMFRGNSLFAFTFVLTCFVTAIFVILMAIALTTLIKDYVSPTFGKTSLKKVSTMMAIIMLANGVGCYDIYGQKVTNCDQIKNFGITCNILNSFKLAVYSEYYMGIVLDNPDMAFLNVTSCSNAHFVDITFGPTKYWRLGTCTSAASNVTNTPLNTNSWNNTGYYYFAPYYQRLSTGVITEALNRDAGVMPYGDQRSMEMLIIMSMKSIYYHMVKDKWYEMQAYGQLKEITKPLNLQGCVETSWEPYESVCSGSIEKGSFSKNFCFGCYGSAICSFSRGNGLNKRKNLACPLTKAAVPKNTRVNMTLTNEGVWASGIYDVSSNMQITTDCDRVISPQMTEFCMKAKGVAVGRGGFTSGFEVKYLKVISDGINDFGFIVELLGQVSFDASELVPGNLCPVVSDIETVSGPTKCLSRGYLVHCILYCEMREPARPGTDIGNAKLMINSYGKGGRNLAFEKTKGNVKRIVKELLTKSRKNARYSLLEPISKNSRASGVDYDNVFITNDGVALGIQEGGPHKLNCYFGDKTSAYCNSTMGFGWIKAVPLKPVYGSNTPTMYVPEGEVYVTFSLNGVSCTGALTDETGELTCDNDCCITSFDNFETFIYIINGMTTRAGGALAQSFKVAAQSRSDGKVTGKIHAQGLNTEFNGTCSRGADVPMLWKCLYEFYPEVFWGVNGTTIAAAVIGLGLLLWHYGVKGLFGHIKNGVSKFGGWLYKTGRDMARKVRAVGGNLNIHSKIKMAELILEGINELKDADNILDHEKEKLENDEMILETKLKKWREEKSKPKDPKRPFSFKKKPNSVSFLDLNTMRNKTLAVARRAQKEETVKLLKKGDAFFKDLKDEIDKEKKERMSVGEKEKGKGKKSW